MLTPIFKTRTFGEAAQPVELGLHVKKMTWGAVGGPLTCRLVCNPAAGNIDLSQLMILMRRPVEIWNEAGALVWWGYVHILRVQDAAACATVNLDDLANRIRVSYIDSDLELLGTKMPVYTGWADELNSQSWYGVKERLLVLKRTGSAQAEAYRALELGRRARPVAVPSVNFSPGSVSVTLECRGWWESLGWRYYFAPDGVVVETTTQIASMAAAGAGGQFLAGVRIGTASGLTGSPLRLGELTAKAEIENHLKAGTVGNVRLLARIGPDRVMVVSSKPGEETCNLKIGRDGLISMGAGITAPTGAEVAGQWAALDTGWAVTSGSWGLVPGRVFLEGVKWEGGKLKDSFGMFAEAN